MCLCVFVCVCLCVCVFVYHLGKTVGLILHHTQSIWNMSKVVVLDNGFCVLLGITELRKKGIFATALVKKRRYYWPKHICGDEIVAHFQEKEVGAVDAWPGTLDGVPFHVVCMKETNYIMSLMTTYGTIDPVGEEKPRSWQDDGGKKDKRQSDIQRSFLIITGTETQQMPTTI